MDAIDQHLQRLTQRRDYLDQRIAAKKAVGWETRYDEDERRALSWALARLRAALGRPKEVRS